MQNLGDLLQSDEYYSASATKELFKNFSNEDSFDDQYGEYDGLEDGFDPNNFPESEDIIETGETIENTEEVFENAEDNTSDSISDDDKYESYEDDEYASSSTSGSSEYESGDMNSAETEESLEEEKNLSVNDNDSADERTYRMHDILLKHLVKSQPESLLEQLHSDHSPSHLLKQLSKKSRKNLLPDLIENHQKSWTKGTKIIFI